MSELVVYSNDLRALLKQTMQSNSLEKNDTIRAGHVQQLPLETLLKYVM